jgi:4-alpha-glucanotransferase
MDWVMVGTHDTPSIWRVARAWDERVRRDRAAHFAARLARTPEERESLARELAADVGALVHAEIADLFACPAAHVVVFFADLFGLEEIYNRPGTFDPDNWTLRLTPDFAERWERGAKSGDALDPRKALAMALRARELGPDATALAERLSAS